MTNAKVWLLLVLRFALVSMGRGKTILHFLHNFKNHVSEDQIKRSAANKSTEIPCAMWLHVSLMLHRAR